MAKEKLVLIRYNEPYVGCSECYCNEYENLAIVSEEHVDACIENLLATRPYMDRDRIEVEAYVWNWTPEKGEKSLKQYQEHLKAWNE